MAYIEVVRGTDRERKMGRYQRKRFPVLRLAITAGIIAIVGAMAYYGYTGASAKNFYLKISTTSHGVGFVSAAKQGKTIGFGGGGRDYPVLQVNQGDTVVLHLINEVEGEKYDLVIPEFNVHSKTLGYFETDSVTFLADKKGNFIYTTTTHPEVKGELVVE